jgi:hypothetical protein
MGRNIHRFLLWKIDRRVSENYFTDAIRRLCMDEKLTKTATILGPQITMRMRFLTKKPCRRLLAPVVFSIV